MGHRVDKCQSQVSAVDLSCTLSPAVRASSVGSSVQTYVLRLETQVLTPPLLPVWFVTLNNSSFTSIFLFEMNALDQKNGEDFLFLNVVCVSSVADSPPTPPPKKYTHESTDFRIRLISFVTSGWLLNLSEPISSSLKGSQSVSILFLSLFSSCVSVWPVGGVASLGIGQPIS